MDLKDFVSESIKQITDGLIESHDYIKSKSPGSQGVETGFKRINFDIGVQSNEGNQNDLGGKITVAQIFQMGTKSETNSSTQNVNRIQFDVQIHINQK